jgi:hypothetical protein
MERPQSPAAAPSPLWRRALPAAIAIGLIAFVLHRIDLHAFARHLADVDAAGFLLFSGAFVIALLTADAFATAAVYRRTVAPVSFRDLWILRGASYLPSLLNHHVGQAFVTYYLARAHRISLARMAGATLLVYVSWSGAILGLGCVALLVTGKSLLWIAAVLAAGIGYLGLIALRPARLAGVKLLAPLFEAGVSGHVFALVVRLPHLAVLFFGTWLPFHFFGVHIPVGAALTYVPILMVAVTLPITPQGFGTRDVLAGAFFAAYAPGESRADQLAAIAAATTSFAVAVTLVAGLLGLALLRRAMPDVERRMPAADRSGPAAGP